ncbi:MAG: radical SAM family heme chaperone HemW [Deltaproteobacteria bacterium]|nr:radical SAM family heme chaperone HemW [Deltaproteobacteria bacterium]
MDFGVYIHFPWCRRRCPYCDFAIAVPRRGQVPHDAYEGAILAELHARTFLFHGRSLASIYFGGGTPAMWSPASVARVVHEVSRVFGASAGELEVTLEANPNDCKREVLEPLREAGITRISIGTQSFAGDELALLGRDHDAVDARSAVAAARVVGFASVSIDLMFALPGQRTAAFRKTLDQAVAMAPDHLSVYQLTIYERTTFGEALRRGRMKAVASEESARQFECAHEVLERAGYEHYEVSSYALPMHRARHNSLYWQGAEYLGMGSGAHSFRLAEDGTGQRWSNHRSVVRYLSESSRAFAGPALPEGDPRVAQVENLSAKAVAEDAIWLGLRTTHGIPSELVAERAQAVSKLKAAGLVMEKGGRLAPTAKGLLFADAIGVELLCC